MSEPLVLLPGMMCDARLYAHQIHALSATRSVTFVPLLEHTTMTSLAAHVLDQAPARFALAGLSMGGIVAMEVVRQAPERVTRLALLDTNPLAEDPQRQKLRAPQIARARAGELRRIMRDEMKPNYLTDGPNVGAILDLCMAMAEAVGAFCSQSLALRDRPDQRETLRAYGRPALLLCGADDQLCPVARHELMHDLLPNSRLCVVDNAGHLPTLEQPDVVTHELLAWLNTAS